MFSQNFNKYFQLLFPALFYQNIVCEQVFSSTQSNILLQLRCKMQLICFLIDRILSNIVCVYWYFQIQFQEAFIKECQHFCVFKFLHFIFWYEPILMMWYLDICVFLLTEKIDCLVLAQTVNIWQLKQRNCFQWSPVTLSGGKFSLKTVSRKSLFFIQKCEFC